MGTSAGADDRRVWWSEGYYDCLATRGRGKADVHRWRSRVHSDDIDEVERTMPNRCRGTGRTSVSIASIARTGAALARVHGRVTYDRDGEPRRMDGVLVDVTERTRLEEDRRDSELRFRRLYEANLVGVVFYHEDGRLMAPNDAFLEMLGVRREIFERYGLDWRQITPPDWADTDVRAWRQLHAVGACSRSRRRSITPTATRCRSSSPPPNWCRDAATTASPSS